MKVKIKKKKQTSIESHYLAVILVVFLLLEGCLFSVTRFSDWQQGVEVLDISSAMSEVDNDFALVFQPIIDTVAGVNKFYELAAAELIVLLQNNPIDMTLQTSFFTDSILSFYDQATTELISLLDFSNTAAWPSSVAGISIVAP